MVALKFIQAFFPASFQRQQGAQWEKETQESLKQAQKKGALSYLKAWHGLLGKSMIKIPLAYIHHWDEMLQIKPSGAPKKPSTYFRAVLRWMLLPFRVFFQTLEQYLVLVVLGAVSSFVVHHVLESKATSDNSSTSEIILSLEVCLVGLMVLWALPSFKKSFQSWKNSGFALVAPITAWVVGLMFGLHVLLYASLNQVTEEYKDVFHAGIAHQKANPAVFDFNLPYSQWTEKQKYWFNPNTHAGLLVKKERLTEWCNIRQASLDAQKIEIQNNINASTLLRVALWNGSMSALASQGCFSQEKWLEEHSAMAQLVSQKSHLFQSTWEPLSWIPMVDRVTASHYITQSLIQPRASSYCSWMAVDMSNSQAVNTRNLSDFCADVGRKIENATTPPPKTWWQRWMWSNGLDQTSRLKYLAQTQHRLSQNDLVLIRQELEANKTKWLREPAQ